MTRNRILLVDDNEMLRLMLADFLQDEGFDVATAENVDAATLLFTQSGSFDILITDVRMPGLCDGIDLAIFAQTFMPMIRVVIMSGYAEQLSERLAATRIRHEFLAKPFSLVQLSQAIGKVELPLSGVDLPNAELA